MERPKRWPNLDPRTPYLSRTIIQLIQQKYADILETYFPYLRIWNSETYGRSVYIFSKNEFVILKCRQFGNLKVIIWQFATLKIENLKVENLKIENLKIENLNTWNYGTWKMKFGNLENETMICSAPHFYQSLWICASETNEQWLNTNPQIKDINFISIKNLQSKLGTFSIFK